jgi:microbial collagenase
MAYAMSGLSGKTPFRASFKSDASADLDGKIVSYRWDFGDGRTSSDPNPTHTYVKAGAYRAKLTVTDNDGSADAYEIPIWAD